MLTRTAEDVLVHVSEFCRSNTVVVEGSLGVLVTDPGIHDHELRCLADDIADLGQSVAMGFSTHPHWDHLLWHEALGDVRRWGTAVGAATAHDRLSIGVEVVAKAVGIPEQVPLDLLGLIDGLPADASTVPWDGPRVRITEHRAHAPGHAFLFIEGPGVLIAGDMLSDVLIPMLDLNGPADPIEDYLAALRLIEDVADDVTVFVPGHGSVGGAGRLRERIDSDRAYLLALRSGRTLDDPRVGPSSEPGWEWVSDIHTAQLQRFRP